MRTTSWASTACIALAALAGGGPAHAREKTPAVDPEAIAALEAMGSFLRAQTSMGVTAEVTTDDVLPSGQKVQYAGRADLRVRRPDRFRADVNSDRKNEQLYYDGKTFTIYQPALKYYASFDAPPTLAELVDVAERRYGLDLPLADLFYWGTERSRVADIKGAVKVGLSSVKGAPCDHWAFHQTDVDWEICIATGDRPVPRKLVITTITERTQPQHVAVLTWDLTPDLQEKMFSFVPPPQAQRIEFQTALDTSPRHGRAARAPRPKGGTP
jgi:hypothetical protein